MTESLCHACGRPRSQAKKHKKQCKACFNHYYQELSKARCDPMQGLDFVSQEWLSKPIIKPVPHTCKQFIRFKSLNKKVCAECGVIEPHILKEGQRPMISSSKDNGL